jgi:hypothetical protein
MPDIFTSNNTTPISNNPPQIKKVNPNKLIDIERNKILFKKERESQMIHIPEGTNIHNLPGHNHNPLTSYCFYPDNVKFVNSDSEEKIITILRRHPITNIPWLILAFFMIIAPSVSNLIPYFDKMSMGYQVILILIWYLVTTAFILEKFLDWFFNVNLITDERILDVNFINLMYREITEAEVEEIQEVTVRPAGGVESFFEYGDVLIQTAAEIPRIIFENVPYPERVAKTLRELQIQEQIEQIEGRVR